MNDSPARPRGTLSAKESWLLLLAAAGIPASLLWDFSWESTVGVDQVWAPPHTASYFAVALAGITALSLISKTTRVRTEGAGGVRLGVWHAPLGMWITAWGAVAFATAVLFDLWWQSAYGLSAGIWHPPQILKAVAFFAVLVGVWLFFLRQQNRSVRKNGPGTMAFAGAGGLVLAMIHVVTLVSTYPNQQHSASFYQLACATYPLVLVALATAGKLRWPATTGALAYLAVACLMVWLLPMWPATPQVAPIYNPLDHLMPPPFPLLLIVPALALDVLLRRILWRDNNQANWAQAGLGGLVFLLVFTGTQWFFATFLLGSSADNWFFAGGGRHWPFFLKINERARTSFWLNPQDQFNLSNVLMAAGLAILAARAGLWLGAWMKRVQQ